MIPQLVEAAVNGLCWGVAVATAFSVACTLLLAFYAVAFVVFAGVAKVIR